VPPSRDLLEEEEGEGTGAAVEAETGILVLLGVAGRTLRIPPSVDERAAVRMVWGIIWFSPTKRPWRFCCCISSIAVARPPRRKGRRCRTQGGGTRKADPSSTSRRCWIFLVWPSDFSVRGP